MQIFFYLMTKMEYSTIFAILFIYFPLFYVYFVYKFSPLLFLRFQTLSKGKQNEQTPANFID